MHRLLAFGQVCVSAPPPRSPKWSRVENFGQRECPFNCSIMNKNKSDTQYMTGEISFILFSIGATIPREVQIQIKIYFLVTELINTILHQQNS